MDEPVPVPLHCHSHYSLLRGVGGPAALVARAAELGYPTLALTDRDALYGAVRFQQACREHGLKPLFGTELTVEPPPDSGLETAHVTLLAMDRTGYANLCRLVSHARLACDKGEARLPAGLLQEHAAGLICLSGPTTSGEPAQLLRAGRPREAARAAARYREAFGDRFYLELQAHGLPDERWLAAELARLGRQLHIPLVATADVHYPSPEDRPLQDVVTCIRTRTTLAAPSAERLPNGQFFLKSPEEFAWPFRRRYQEALEQTQAIAARCDVALDWHDVRFPALALPEGRTPDQELRRRCEAGARRHYGELSEPVRRQLDHELALIAARGLAPFFLIAAEVAERFRGRCRGSAAGSLVVYCLGVSVVDPLAHGMLFERFINPERDSPPDIDVDFSEAERERAIAHCYQTYGEAAAMVCNYVRFRARSAVRDVGRVLGMPAPLVDRLARSLDHHDADDLAAAIARLARRAPGEQQPWPLLVRFCRQLDDVPRHLSVHVGGMLLTGQPLVELFGLEPARKPGVVVVGADKEDVEDLGLAKLDLLCLRALSVVQECEMLERARGLPLDLATIPLDDPRVYAALGRADTIGASQVESRAQQQSIVRTRPRTFSDLMAQVAIIRPGPVQGGMVHPYYRRRAGTEPVRYLHPSLEPILRSTLGIFLYQEQVLLGVSALTGCSAGEADRFRRAIGSHRSHEAMARLRPWFLERAVANGIPAPVAATAFEQISAFADYGFCQSHAAALARLAYETMYLKLYHPAAFAAALLDNQPLGFYPPEVLVWDARRHGVAFLPVDIDQSSSLCTLEGDPPAVRLGLARVKGVGAAAAEALVGERAAHGPYRSLADCCRRTGLPMTAVEALVLAGAFDRFGGTRQELLWDAYALAGAGAPQRSSKIAAGSSAAGRAAELDLPEERPVLPPRPAHEQTLLDYAVLGFSLDHHLVAHYRRRLAGLRVVPSTELARWPDGGAVRVGGLVVCHQAPPTAKGFVFLTLEDEHGLVNVIVRPAVYARSREVLRDQPLVAIAGRVQRGDGPVNVLAERAVALDLAVPDPEREQVGRPAAAAPQPAAGAYASRR
jgi:error-prone DNA polymerase